MKHKLTYITIISLLFHSFLIQSQTKVKDSIPEKVNRYGLFVGIDLYKLALTAFDDDYYGIELTGQYRLSKKMFLASEIGTEEKTVNDDQLSFTTNGQYITAGFNYNFYNNWVPMENQIYVGLRYGYSYFSQTLNNYKIYNPNPYFPVNNPIIESGEEFTGLSAQWIEIIAGVNVQVYKNIFVGFSVNMNVLLVNDTPPNFDNLYIPGFNRTYDGDFGAGFNYSISYFIPFYKRTASSNNNAKK
ncbi:MAG TPA: DUF6048 family protein [Flavobacterium sp.]|nr:DUF6048 family protein [Flavobacterium sp.]